MGLECIGAANNESVTEVLDLAEQSLSIISEGNDYVLKVSDLDILTFMLDEITENIPSGKYLKTQILKLAGDKNTHEIASLCKSNDISEDAYMPIVRLLGLYGAPEEVFPELAKICEGTAAQAEVGELIEVISALPVDVDASRRIVLDFSLTSNTSYYNGIAFEGYIDGVPECVLVGGRYDMLMQRMKKRSRAIGFAVYLDNLARLKMKVGDKAIDHFYRNVATAEE